MCKKLTCFILVALILGTSVPAIGGMIVAEELLVDLRAADLDYGIASTWTNHGSLGNFAPMGTPVVEDVAGRKAVTFDGSSYFEGPDSSPGLEGARATRSIEVWAYNPAIPGEETIVSWAHRGGPDGTNMAFNYGNDVNFGAVGHWGAPDMGWTGEHAPAPEAENWWYLVYTYDGTTVQLYVNGEANTAEDSVLNTFGGTPIRVAAQADGSGAGVEAGFNFTGSIAEVRIHDGVLSAADVANNFVSMPGEPIARGPVPGDGAVDVPRDIALGWTASELAATHDVYFGTVLDDVTNAERADPMGVLVSQGQAGTTYDPEGLLELGQTYYWRVDEVNAAPDFGIFRGDLWSFTAEPLAYPITNIIATASSSHNDDMGPEKTIDGSGLSADGRHSVAGTDMWLSGGSDPGPIWIQYEFDAVYQLHEMLVWNANQTIEAFVGFGAKDVAVEYSADGADWTVLEGATQFAQATGSPSYTSNTMVEFGGAMAKFVKITIADNWGVVGQYGLSEVQISYIPVQAREPQPAAGAVDVAIDSMLDWRGGRGAVSHEVILDTDEAAVVDGTAPAETVTDSEYDPGILDLGTTYFWKVNEIDEAGTTVDGALWSFTTQEYVVVEDFEGFTDDEGTRIYETWIDGWDNGTGSQVGYTDAPFAERAEVYSGRQSMPLLYDNSAAPFVSETDRKWDSAQDWTRGGATTLVIHFRGNLDNDPAPIYVVVNGEQVDSDAGVTTVPWKPWAIDLAEFGAEARKVKTFTIGIGNGSAGGTGTVFVDDIRLYTEAPATPVAADPGTDALVAYYGMENNLQDATGNGYDATGMNSPAFKAGASGMGLAFNGLDQYVELPIGPLLATLSDITVATWVDFDNAGDAWQRIFDFGNSSSTGYLFLCPRIAGAGPIRSAITPAAGAGESIVESPDALSSGWHHVAVTIDSASMTLSLYVDGVLVDSDVTDTLPKDLGATTQNWLGRSQYAADGYFMGSLDEFQIYSRALSTAEIRYLAGDR